MPTAKPKTVRVKAEHLLTFCEVARCGNVSEAASELNLSQPAVSRQLASLQHAARQTFYRRSAHGVELTQAGRELLPFACSVAQALKHARRHLRQDAAERPTRLRLGLSHHLVTRYTGPLLKAAKRYNDEVGELELHLLEGYSAPLIDQVSNQELVAALTLSGPSTAAATSRRLSEEQVCLLTLPDDPIAAQAYVPLSIIEGETLVMPSAVSSVYNSFQAALSATRVKPGKVLEVSGPAAVRSAVLAGQGVGVTLRSFAQPEVQAGWFRQVGIENVGFTVGIWWVTRQAAELDEATHHALETLLSFTTREHDQT